MIENTFCIFGDRDAMRNLRERLEQVPGGSNDSSDILTEDVRREWEEIECWHSPGYLELRFLSGRVVAVDFMSAVQEHFASLVIACTDARLDSCGYPYAQTEHVARGCVTVFRRHMSNRWAVIDDSLESRATFRVIGAVHDRASALSDQDATEEIGFACAESNDDYAVEAERAERIVRGCSDWAEWKRWKQTLQVAGNVSELKLFRRDFERDGQLTPIWLEPLPNEDSDSQFVDEEQMFWVAYRWRSDEPFTGTEMIQLTRRLPSLTVSYCRRDSEPMQLNRPFDRRVWQKGEMSVCGVSILSPTRTVRWPPCVPT